MWILALIICCAICDCGQLIIFVLTDPQHRDNYPYAVFFMTMHNLTAFISICIGREESNRWLWMNFISLMAFISQLFALNYALKQHLIHNDRTQTVSEN